MENKMMKMHHHKFI